MKKKQDKLEKLESFGIIRNKNKFSNGVISCEFITPDYEDYELYGYISGYKIEFTNQDGFVYEEEVSEMWFDACDDLENIYQNEKDERDKSIVETLLNIFLNPKELIQKSNASFTLKKYKNGEEFRLNELAKKDIEFNPIGFCVYDLDKVKYKVTNYARGDHDSTIKKTETKEHLITYNGTLIFDNYIENIIPKGEETIESIKSWSTTGFNDSEECKLNIDLTKKLQKEYNAESHKNFNN